MAFVSVACDIRQTSFRAPPLHSRRSVSRQRSLHTSRRSRARALVSSGPGTSEGINTSTEDTFAIDAGRDLFFPQMDADMAINILDKDLGSLKAKDDRFIAAERLKFFASDKAAEAIIRFVQRFEAAKMEEYVLEDKVARRKAVESLGRQKGAFRRDEVVQLLSKCLQDEDKYMVEVAVWALGEVGVTNENNILEAITAVLDNDAVEKRVVIQTLMRASYAPALPKIRTLVDSDNAGVASAAMAAVAVLTADNESMKPVINILKFTDVNIRRAAIEDITLSEYVPALEHVAVCPNSLVLRARTVRRLLDVIKTRKVQDGGTLDNSMFELVDRLIWDHPCDLDLLNIKKETRKSRDPSRNIRQLYKNDAVFAYAASKCLAEDHRHSEDGEVGAQVKKSYDDLAYFDYFGSYHVYKTLGWLRYADAYEMLLDNAQNLPPRFFNHQAGAITALAEIGNTDALPVVRTIAEKSSLWELKYACLIAAERLGDGQVRSAFKEDSDWLIRARASSGLRFDHLRNTFDV